ncbi:MAG TPA: copper resistance protein CopC [Gaiellaceae bacterium]|nr:copper resistance protein CopC [Gaiellaceae bacterium]
MRLGLALLAVVAALALPAAAWAHAGLVRTVPRANVVLDRPPPAVRLTYTEAVEPRFAAISVTNAAGEQQTTGPPKRSPTDAKTLVVPLGGLNEGWYLVYWRAISVDGHPVRGAFTFAVGPNPGPQPQFVIPSISETAATPRLIAARSVVFVAFMAAIGLFVLRIATARPVVQRVPESRLRPLDIAFGIASMACLVAIPVYLVMTTAQFALRSAFDLGALFPLLRASAFGRGLVDLEIVFALFVLAGGLALWIDRPQRERRSIAELLSIAGAFAAAGAVLLVPGLAGHAAQTSPRGAMLLFDWLHLAAGSIWVGGLLGLLVLWWSFPVARRVAGLVVCVPRFSNAAFVSVLVLIGSGIGASLVHLPTFASLWQTSYGQALLVKIGLLCTALLLAAVNLLRTRPRLLAYRERPELGPGAAGLLRPLVAGEVLLVVSAVVAAAALSSLPPPSKALAKVGGASARVGPGPVAAVVDKNGYRVELHVSPNRAAAENTFSLRVTRGGRPVTGAEVVVGATMLDMEMGTQSYALSETAPGVYSHAVPALVMVGHWGLSFDITPKNGSPFSVLLVDRANG